MEQNENYGQNEGSGAKEPCVSIAEYLELDALPEKIKWLQKNGHNVCEPGMSQALEDIHRIKPSYNVTRPTSGIFSIGWGDLKKFIGNGMYNAYLSFEKDVNGNIIDIKLVRQFTINVSCYSFPLLRNIATVHKLKDEDYFEFFSVELRGMMTIAIGINGVNGLNYYDYSDEPGLVPLKSPL